MTKQLVALMTLASLVFGPASALATTINTSMTKGAAAGNAPSVLVKWEMNGPAASLLGTDDKNTAGAQFNPSAQYGVNKKIAVCGIVTDPDGVANIDAVYGNIWYPTNVYLGEFHEQNRQGCGQELGTQCKMKRLAKLDGLELFCNKIKNNNSNLPTWVTTEMGYDYLCKADGELQKETAYVACCDRELIYEDPSGDYRVVVSVSDTEGNNGTLENYFTYLPITAFETDFTAVGYGDVRLNTPKIINGDLPWAGQTLPSVRNIGNTRVQLSINQDDMGIGQTDGLYNVDYKARIGNVEGDWSNWYQPYKLTWLKKTLDLSETNEMDFQIKVKKFPAHLGNEFQGTMTLGSKFVAHYDCCSQ